MVGTGGARGRRCGAIAAIGVLLAGCATTTPENAFQPKAEVLALRQLQTRRFDTDEKTLLKASVGVLQDLGFIVNEVNTEVGLISCSKKRDAKEAGQILLGILAMMFYVPPSWDVEQVIRVSVATNPVRAAPAAPSAATTVRVTFQRIVTKADKNVRWESIADPAIYRVFFEKLSASVFLEAQEL